MRKAMQHICAVGSLICLVLAGAQTAGGGADLPWTITFFAGFLLLARAYGRLSEGRRNG